MAEQANGNGRGSAWIIRTVLLGVLAAVVVMLVLDRSAASACEAAYLKVKAEIDPVPGGVTKAVTVERIQELVGFAAQVPDDGQADHYLFRSPIREYRLSVLHSKIGNQKTAQECEKGTGRTRG
jgi:hypothetical protein